jgi:hypothetical protein
MAGLTASEMMYEAKVLYESMASADAPGFTPREWSVLLTQAQEKLVLELCGEGVDKDTFNRIALSQLKEYGIINLGSIYNALSLTGYQNSFRVDRSGLNQTVNGFVYRPLFFFEQRGNATLGAVSLTNVKIKEVEEDYVSANTDNPYKNPNKIIFWQLPYKNDSVIVITNGTNLQSYYCGYIKKPYPIIVPYSGYTSAMTIEGYNLNTGTNPDGNSVLTYGIDCKLHVSLHRKIVQEAAALAKATNKDQMALQLQKMQENS